MEYLNNFKIYVIIVLNLDCIYGDTLIGEKYIHKFTSGLTIIAFQKLELYILSNLYWALKHQC